jgi:hypothetical protein
VSAHATTEQLEELLGGELPTEKSAPIESHLASCAACQKELAWVRSERALFNRRPRASLPPGLWQGIEARLPPAASAPLALPVRPRSQRRQWFAVAAAAVLLVGFALGGVPIAGLRQRLVAGFGTSGAGSGRHDDPDQPPRTTLAKVSGPVTLRIKTASADVTAVAGDRETVRATVTDSDLAAIELRTEGSGELRLFGDGRDGLRSGHVQLELPPGSRLEVTTASGEVSITDVGGDAVVRTASGDISVHGCKNLEVETASGDLAIDQLGGAARIRTVSGDANITSKGALSAFSFSSTSGELRLEGGCAADCRVQVHTVSGDVHLKAPGERSFTVLFHSQSGELQGGPEPERNGEDEAPAHDRTVRFGAGAGQVSVTTVSGDLQIETP